MGSAAELFSAVEAALNDREIAAYEDFTDAVREVLALARQAEALQRENAELREVLADSLSAFRCTQNVDRYPADHWCRRARALLGGSENAGN